MLSIQYKYKKVRGFNLHEVIRVKGPGNGNSRKSVLKETFNAPFRTEKEKNLWR